MPVARHDPSLPDTLADLTAAQCHPTPRPVLANSAAEAAQMRTQRVYQLLHMLVRGAHT